MKDRKSNLIHDFTTTQKNSYWRDVKDSKWNSWVWQQQKRIKTISELEKVIELTNAERKGIEGSTQFRMAITPYYASLMDPKDPHCPIRMQCVPTDQELKVLPHEIEDPLAEESHMPVPGLTHRYPDRALLYASHHCPVYCRHCTRKRKVSDPNSVPLKNQIDRAIEYIQNTPQIKDVLVSGGDPLSLSNDRVVEIFSKLRRIPHVEILRLSTRNIVTLPQRIDDELVQRLRAFQPIFVHTHFNHPKECTEESMQAVSKFVDNGFIVNNQMVLLRGINDDSSVVKYLNQTLLRMRVQPYYMIHCDLAQGIGHFRAKVEDGLKIIDDLRGRVSGMAIPHYVVDLTPGGGKVAMTPNKVVSHENEKWIFKNYQGKTFHLDESHF